MEREEVLERFRNSIASLDRDEAVKAAKEALELGVSAHNLIEEMRKASEGVGEKWEAREYFISELIIAGIIMKAVTDILKPHMVAEEVEYRGTVIIGSTPGDLHDIGKNLAAMCLMGAGFRVVDLGIDVSPERFVEAVKKEKGQIVGISALTSATMLTIGDVVKAIVEAGLRTKVKVVVGGAPLTQAFAKASGADACANDAIHGVRICEEWGKELPKKKSNV